MRCSKNLVVPKDMPSLRALIPIFAHSFVAISPSAFIMNVSPYRRIWTLYVRMLSFSVVPCSTTRSWTISQGLRCCTFCLVSRILSLAMPSYASCYVASTGCTHTLRTVLLPSPLGSSSVFSVLWIIKARWRPVFSAVACSCFSRCLALAPCFRSPSNTSRVLRSLSSPGPESTWRTHSS